MSVDVHQSVVYLIEAAQSQIEVGMAMSWAGMGFVLHFIFKGYGWYSNERRSVRLNRTWIMWASFSLFLVSYLIGYTHGNMIGGYYYEMVSGKVANDCFNSEITKEAISDSSRHFLHDYKDGLQILGLLQVRLTLSGWSWQ